MNRDRFMRQMMLEAGQHWDNMLDISEDDDDCLAPEKMSEAQLVGTFADSMHRYSEILTEQDDIVKEADKRIKHRAYLEARG